MPRRVESARRVARVAALALGISACSGGEEPELELDVAVDRAGEVGACPGVDDPVAARADFVARLFPDSAIDDAIFCAFEPGSNVCTPQGLHMGGVIPFAGAVPSEATCRAAAGATLAKCDNYAKHLVTSALDTGDLIKLVRGATRMRDVMQRPGAPSYYAANSAANRFAKWLGSTGVALGPLGKCTTGTDSAGYLCLATDAAAPSRASVRGLLELLDRHNGVLVRHGALAGAAQRSAKIFASATGPLAARLAQSGAFAPADGPGVQRVQTLAKVFALRLLDGTAATDAGNEIDAFVAMRGFVPPGVPDTDYGAGLGLLAAQTGARSWFADARKPQTLDGPLAHDLGDFFAILTATAQTARALGRCDLGQEVADLYVRTGSTNLFGANFPNKSFVVDASDSMSSLSLATLHGMLLLPDLQYVDPCHVHQELVSFTTSWIDEIVVPDEMWVGDTFTGNSCETGVQWVDQNHNTGEIVDCWCSDFSIDVDPDGSIHQDECIEWTIDVQYDDAFDEWVDLGTNVQDQETRDLLATSIVKDKVHLAYRDLLTSDDDLDGTIDVGEIYDHSAVAGPDLHHIEDQQAHMTILRTSVGWDECEAEIVASSTTFASTPISSVSCAPDDVDGDGVVDIDASCTTESLVGDTFVPYALAVHACPQYTAKVVGVLDSSFAMNQCATPWSFTQAVQYYLENDGVPDDVIATFPEYGSMVKPLVIDFAAEAIALSQPVAAMYRHRADFASVVGNVPGAVPAGSKAGWYDANAGLAVVDANLALGESVMAGGIDLFADFERLTVWGETARHIIARLSADAFSSCTSPGCDDNERLHARAELYRRLRDGIETYAQLSSARMETQWRRLDGEICFDDDGVNGFDRCDSCMFGVDSDGDQLFDAQACDADLDLDLDGLAGDCTEQCAYFEIATDLAGVGGARMADLAATLEVHSTRAVLDPDQQDFLAGAASYAAGVGTQLARDYDALVSGTDWLGYRVGLWYPGINVDPVDGSFDTSDQIDAKLTELQTAAASANYDTFIDDYLQRVTNLQDWSDAMDQSNQSAANGVADYCSGGADACDSAASSEYADVAAINSLISTTICGRQITLSHFEQGSDGSEDVVSLDYPVGPTGVPCVEPLVSPDLDAVAQYNGSIPLQAEVVRAQLAQIEANIADIDAYFTLIEANDRARLELGRDLLAVAEVEEKIQRIRDGVVCGFAIAGAVAVGVAAVVCDASTVGGCTPPSTGAVIEATAGAAATCAMVSTDESVFDTGAPNQKELERAYTEFTMTLQTNEEAYTLASKMSSLITLVANYKVELVRYQNLLAELHRKDAFDNAVLDDLVDLPLFDPSVQLFADESLGAMKNLFRETAKDARDLHHLVQYDIGQSVREGGGFSIGSGDVYYLPRLASITIHKGYGGSSLDTAYDDLASPSGDEAGVASNRGFNLIAYASLIKYVHATFVDVYGDRVPSATPVYIGAPQSGLPGVDRDGDDDTDEVDATMSVNPGDRALLGDSPFYDPWIVADAGADDGSGCARGTIDISAYCTTFEDLADNEDPNDDEVPENTCLDVKTLSELERYSLAYADHMTRDVGVQTFACRSQLVICSAFGEDGLCLPGEEDTIAPYIAVAPDADGDGVFTFAELGGSPTEVYSAADTTFYGAQTPTVRGIVDRFVREKTLHDATLDYSSLDMQPGTYMFLVNMATDSPVDGVSAASFDPEEDLTFNESISRDSISEQLTSVAVVCTDQVSCNDDDNTFTADVMFFGPGYLGDRCLHRTTTRQERVAFAMEPERILALPARKFLDAQALDEDLAVVLAEPGVRDQLGAQPIHGNSWLLTMRGHSDAGGDARTPGWALYRHAIGQSSIGPRLRIAMAYSYYEATAQTGDFEYDVTGLLECNDASDSSLCVNGTCD